VRQLRAAGKGGARRSGLQARASRCGHVPARTSEDAQGEARAALPDVFVMVSSSPAPLFA
jgi:hypothetical protein